MRNITTPLLWGLCAATFAINAGGCDLRSAKQTPECRVESFYCGPVYIDPSDQTGMIVSHRFLYHNPTDRTIKLSVSRNCQCTDATPGKYILSGGESTPFTLAFPLSYSVQRFKQFAVVAAENDARVKPVEFDVLVDVCPRILIIPDHPAEFSAQPGESVISACRVVTYQDGSEPPSAISIESDNSVMTVQNISSPLVAVENGIRRTEWKCDCHLTFPVIGAVDQKQNPTGANLIVRHGKWHSRTAFNWRLVLPVDIKPSQLFLRTGHEIGDHAVASRFTVQGERPFSIMRVEFCTAGSSPVVVSGAQTAVERVHSVAIHFPHNFIADYTKMTFLRFVTSDPHAPVVTVPVFSF